MKRTHRQTGLGLARCGEAEYFPGGNPLSPTSCGCSLLPATQPRPQPASTLSSRSETQAQRPPPQFSPAKRPWPGEDILPQPHKESRQCWPRPFPGLSFKLSSSVHPSPPVAQAPSTPRAPQSPNSLGLTNLRKRGGGAAKFSQTDPFSHTQNHLFARWREQRKSLTSTIVQQLKLGLRMQLGHRRPSPCCLHKAGSGFANLGRQREKFVLPF